MSDSRKKLDEIRASVLSPSADKRLYVRDSLRQLGIKNAETFSKPIELWGALERHEVDLIIADWKNNYPGDGLEIISKVRNSPDFFNVGCIIMTSLIDREHVTSAVDSEVDEFLGLPFTTQTIQATALKTLQKRLYPTPYMSSLNTASIHMKKREYPEAHDALKEALSQNPAPATAHYYLGFIDMIHNKLDRALHSFEQGLSTHPIHMKCLFGKAFLYRTLGRMAAYEETLESILKIFPCHPTSQRDFLKLKLDKNDFKSVLSGFDYLFSVKKEFPRLNGIIEELAAPSLTKIFHHDPKIARVFVQRFQLSSPHTLSTRRSMILTYSELGLHSDADLILAEYRIDAPPDYPLELELATIRFNQGRYRDVVAMCFLMNSKFGERADTLKLELAAHSKMGNVEDVELVRRRLMLLAA